MSYLGSPTLLSTLKSFPLLNPFQHTVGLARGIIVPSNHWPCSSSSALILVARSIFTGSFKMLLAHHLQNPQVDLQNIVFPFSLSQKFLFWACHKVWFPHSNMPVGISDPMSHMPIAVGLATAAFPQGLHSLASPRLSHSRLYAKVGSINKAALNCCAFQLQISVYPVVKICSSW